MINKGVTIGVIKPASGGTETPGLSDVLAVSNRNEKFIVDLDYYFQAGDETKELFLAGEPHETANLYLLTEVLPFGSELIINAYQKGAFLDYGDEEVVYSYDGRFLQSGDEPIEIPFGAKCIIRNIEGENFFFVSIIKQVSTIEPLPLCDVLNIGDRTLNASLGNNLPLDVYEMNLFVTSKNDHIVFTDENLLNNIILVVNDDDFLPNSGAVLKITNASSHRVELRPRDGITILADNLFIKKNNTALLKFIYETKDGVEYNARTFFLTYETNIIEQRKAIYYAKQDITGFIDFEQVRNDFKDPFEFVRIVQGCFDCHTFNPMTMIIYSQNSVGRLFWSPEDNAILTVDKEYNTIDTHFEFGGFIIIEEMIR